VEITGEVTSTTMRAGSAMFYGSTVRGNKWLDSVFFLMNPAS
jgi:glycerol-3-phosphate acyltransferase